MNKPATMHEAKTNLSKYAAAARRGEKVLIGDRGKPEFQLVYLKYSEQKPKRKLGIFKGTMTVSDDAFSKETDEEIAKLMYGEA